MFIAYMRTFARMGLKAIPMRADTGPIGGDLSHEFHILAETGESAVFVASGDCMATDWAGREVDYASDLQPMVDELTGHYAATEEKHDPAMEKTLGDRLLAAARHRGRSHLLFRHQILEADECHGARPRRRAGRGRDGLLWHRRVAAGRAPSSRPSHDEAGIIWPEPVAPFRVGLINLKPGDAACDEACERLYRFFDPDVLYDDRDERAGVKFAEMDLIGLPWQVVVGPKGIANGMVEVKRRGADGGREEMSLEAALAKFAPSGQGRG